MIGLKNNLGKSISSGSLSARTGIFSFLALSLIGLSQAAFVESAFIESAKAQSANSQAGQNPAIVVPAPAGGTLDPDEQTTSPGLDIGPIDGVILRDIVVEGEQRIEDFSVIAHLGLTIGERVNQEVLNGALKRIFATGLFADVDIEQRGDILVVRVVENPIINRIVFEGNDKIDDEVLEAEVQLRPRVVYTRTRVQSDVQRLLDLYRRSGRFAATVAPKIIELEQNRIDLVFEVKEGEKTGIRGVSFVGNRYFSDGALADVINTKESRWYRFFGSGDTYDPDKLNFDKELLRRYYLANGFADFRVTSAVAELTEDQKDFFITFTLEEGPRYRFGTFDLVSRIPDLPAEPLKPLIELETGDWYDADSVSDTVSLVSTAAGNEGYAFVNVRTVPQRNPVEQTIDITFEILEAPRVFVERVDIQGNVRTLDEVIRREIELVEGDVFNSDQFSRSRRNIQNLGYFSKVNVSNVPGSGDDKTVVNVEVEEQSTGELSVGAGYSSSDGALAQLQLRERNLMGRGQDLRLALGLAQRRQSIDLSFTEPYFLEKELSAGFDVFHTLTDYQDSASFDNRRSGAGVRLGYDLDKNWRQLLRYRFAREEVYDISDSASEYIQDDTGVHDLSTIGQRLTFDKRNSRIDPTEGGVISLSTDFTGLGGTMEYMKTTLNTAYYVSLADDFTLKLAGTLGMINNFGDELRVSDRFFLGGDSLRGFSSGGVGPRDTTTTDALGGERYATGTIELSFPLGLPEEYGIKGSVFTDVGTLSELEDSGSNIVDDDSLRVGSGVGMSWRSPFGPIRLDYAKALKKTDNDKTESFRINFGTRF